MDPPSNLSINYLNLLPDELLLEILIKTDDLDTLSRWCQTSKRINNICQDKVLWKQKYQKNFGGNVISGETVLIEGDTWKELYKLKSLIGINSPISVGLNGYGIIDQKGNLYMTGEKQILGIGPQPQIGCYSRKQHLVKFPSGNSSLSSLSHLYNLSQKVVSISVYGSSVGAVTADGKVYVWGDNSFRWFCIGKGIKVINFPKEFILPHESEENPFEGVSHRLITFSKKKLPRKAIRIEVGPRGYIVLFEDFTFYFLRFSGRFQKTYFRHITNLKIIDMSIHTGVYSIITKDHELYIGGDIFRNKPSRSDELILLKFPKPIKRAIFGNDFLMVLSITGEVYTQKYYDNTYEGIIFSKTKPKLIKLPEQIIQISIRRNTYAAISETGKLYMWGCNYYDQITSSELMKRGSRLEGISEPVEISIGLPINFVSAGPESTLAVSNDGSVNHWSSSRFRPE